MPLPQLINHTQWFYRANQSLPAQDFLVWSILKQRKLSLQLCECLRQRSGASEPHLAPRTSSCSIFEQGLHAAQKTSLKKAPRRGESPNCLLNEKTHKYSALTKEQSVVLPTSERQKWAKGPEKPITACWTPKQHHSTTLYYEQAHPEEHALLSGRRRETGIHGSIPSSVRDSSQLIFP